jgi:hypothetical protein
MARGGVAPRGQPPFTNCAADQSFAQSHGGGLAFASVALSNGGTLFVIQQRQVDGAWKCPARKLPGRPNVDQWNPAGEYGAKTVRGPHQ